MTRACIIALGFTFVTALAAQGAPPRHAQWMGEATCSAWPAHQAYDDFDKALLLNWVLGWLSRGGKEGPDLLASVDQVKVSAWIDRYCTANPRENLITAANTLERELAMSGYAL
jgi:hypothetical protein